MAQGGQREIRDRGLSGRLGYGVMNRSAAQAAGLERGEAVTPPRNRLLAFIGVCHADITGSDS
ncbi:MAG: hypothetical protein NTZ75_01850 [Euryarchaeota archaeon]|nr:hypothetical protein [Euryarchaeota archaeon]